MATEKVINLNVNSNLEGSIGQLKALKRELKGVDVGTEEFKRLYNQIDNLEDKIKSAKNKSSDWVDSLEQAGGPIGMLGASINKAKVATQTFGGALKATGIGLIVSLVAGLAAAFNDNEKAQKKLQPLLDGLKKIFAGVFAVVEPLFNILVDLAISALPTVSKAFSAVYSSVTAVFESLGSLGSAIKKLISGDFSGAWKDAKSSVTDFGKHYDEANKRFEQGSKELTKTQKEELEKRREEEKKHQEELAKRQKELQAKNKEIVDKKAEEEKKRQDDKLQSMLDELDAMDAFDQRVIDNDAKKKEELKKQDDAAFSEMEAQFDKETKEREDKAKKELDIENAVAQGKKNIQEATYSTIESGIGLLKGLFEKNKAIQKGLLLAESAVGIAKIINQTTAADAADTAYAATMGPAGAAYKATKFTLNRISAGIGIATNIAATAKALSALGGGSSTSKPTMGGDSGGSAAAPKFNVVGNAGVNQIAQTMNNQQQQPIQAYVVAQNVTTAQSLNRNIVSNASLG